MPMIAITTSNSVSVNASKRRWRKDTDSHAQKVLGVGESIVFIRIEFGVKDLMHRLVQDR